MLYYANDVEFTIIHDTYIQLYICLRLKQDQFLIKCNGIKYTITRTNQNAMSLEGKIISQYALSESIYFGEMGQV